MEKPGTTRAIAAASAVAASLGLAADDAIVLHDSSQIVASPDLSPELANTDRAFLSGRLGSLRQAIEDRGAVEQLLHGEPHPGNVLSTKYGPLFIDFETCCRGPVEFDLAHVTEAVCERYPSIDRELLDECRQLVLAMVAAWRWDRDDQFPNGKRFGEELLRSLRAGPPWPTLDAVIAPTTASP